PYALGGLLVCGSCGWRMTGTMQEGVRYYRCGNYLMSGRAGCFCNMVPEKRVLNSLLRKLEAIASDPVLMREFEQRVRQQEEEARQAAPRQAADLRKRIEALERKIGQGVERMALIEPDVLTEYAAAIRGWKEERDRLKEEQRQQSAAVVPCDVEAVVRATRDVAGLMREAFENEEYAELRELFGELASKVELFFEQRPTSRKGMMRSYFTHGV